MAVHNSPESLRAENHSLRTEVAQLKHRQTCAAHEMALLVIDAWDKLPEGHAVHVARHAQRAVKILEGK